MKALLVVFLLLLVGLLLLWRWPTHGAFGRHAYAATEAPEAQPAPEALPPAAVPADPAARETH